MQAHKQPFVFFRKIDGILVLFLITAAIAWIVLQHSVPQNGQAILRRNGDYYMTLPLSSPTEVRVENHEYFVTVTVADGRVCVTDCNCPDSLCQHAGPISKIGQTIVCLPAAISITIEGNASSSSPDGITF